MSTRERSAGEASVRAQSKEEVAQPEEPAALNLKSLKDKKIGDLAAIAKDMNIEGAAAMRKQELIFSILQAQTEQNGFICGEGVNRARVSTAGRGESEPIATNSSDEGRRLNRRIEVAIFANSGGSSSGSGN